MLEKRKVKPHTEQNLANIQHSAYLLFIRLYRK